MLEPSRALSPQQLEEVADLEKRVVAADGGRLKLEWGVLRSRPGDRVEDLLWREDGRLTGFLGLYAFSPAVVELVGMVDPSARRRGTGRALLDAALPLVHERAYPSALLVVPRGSAGGAALASGVGAPLDHSEHALVLHGEPAPAREDPAVALRRAGAADAALVGRLLRAAFGHAAPGLADRLADPRERTLVIEHDGTPVGTVRLTLEAGQGGVYGFAVDPARQGRGIGRDVLTRVCRLLADEGATHVGLEVEVDNEAALGLYTRVGFRPVTTEDYYRLPV